MFYLSVKCNYFGNIQRFFLHHEKLDEQNEVDNLIQDHIIVLLIDN